MHYLNDSMQYCSKDHCTCNGLQPSFHQRVQNGDSSAGSTDHDKQQSWEVILTCQHLRPEKLIFHIPSAICWQECTLFSIPLQRHLNYLLPSRSRRHQDKLVASINAGLSTSITFTTIWIFEKLKSVLCLNRPNRWVRAFQRNTLYPFHIFKILAAGRACSWTDRLFLIP